MHLKPSPRTSLQFQALRSQELNPEKSPLCQLVQRLTTSPTPNNPNSLTSPASQTPIRVNQIIQQRWNTYLEPWRTQTQSQTKLNCFLDLKQEYRLAGYLLTVRDMKQRRILTKYRLSDHSLALETGRLRQSWLPREDRVCGHCRTGEVETEVHFLLNCPRYEPIRTQYFNKIIYINLIKLYKYHFMITILNNKMHN